MRNNDECMLGGVMEEKRGMVRAVPLAGEPCASILGVDQCRLQLAGRRLHACGSATRTRLDQTNLS